MAQATAVKTKRDAARFRLRDATAAAHRLTEAAFAPYDLADPAHYARFLAAHVDALLVVEPGLQHGGWRDWSARSHLAISDLAGLGHRAPEARSDLPGPRKPAACWGAQYVLEGSKLGGKLLVRQVGEGLPVRYLSPGTDSSADWQQFCASLDEAAGENNALWLEHAIGAAIRTFEIFTQAAKRHRPNS